MTPPYHFFRRRRQGVGAAVPNRPFPLPRALCDIGVFLAICLTSGYVSLAYVPSNFWLPASIIVGITFVGLWAGGAYRSPRHYDVFAFLLSFTRGFVLAAVPLLLLIPWLVDISGNYRFLFLYLFLVYIVLNTLRPIMLASEVG